MAFYDYILLDGYRYKALAKQWRPQIDRPASARMTLLGNLEATFGVAALQRWEGAVSVSHGEASPGAADGTRYGNIYTLRLTLKKCDMVSFTDHNGNTYTVVAQGPFDEQSLVNIWNSAANKYFVRIALTAKAN